MSPTTIEQAARESATQLARYVSRIHARGWCEGTSGNYSVTLSRDPLALVITRSGIDKGHIGVEDFLILDDQSRARTIAERHTSETPAPSAESLLHVRIAETTGAGAILHTHSVWGTLLGRRHVHAGGFDLTGLEMLKGIEGVQSHDEKVRIPIVENSQDMVELGERILPLLRDDPRLRGFLIAGHGLYTWGKGVAEAYRQVEIFEFLFEIAWRELAAG